LAWPFAFGFACAFASPFPLPGSAWPLPLPLPFPLPELGAGPGSAVVVGGGGDGTVGAGGVWHGPGTPACRRCAGTAAAATTIVAPVRAVLSLRVMAHRHLLARGRSGLGRCGGRCREDENRKGVASAPIVLGRIQAPFVPQWVADEASVRLRSGLATGDGTPVVTGFTRKTFVSTISRRNG